MSHSRSRKPPKARVNFCGRTRREMLWEAGAGFTGLAMAGLLGQNGGLASGPTRRDR